MQTYINFIDELVELVISTTDEKKQVLALDICQKLYPYFQNYSKNETDSLLLKEAIDLCRQDNVEPLKHDDCIARIEKLIPELTEMPTWEESYATNAIESVIELLKFKKDSDNKHIIDICSLMIDNVDYKLAEENEDITDDEIYEHHTMREAMQQIKMMLE